jgi:hypothetical protein
MQETEGSQPVQAARQLQMGGMPGLQGNRQTKHEESQSVNEIDDLFIDGKQVPDKVDHEVNYSIADLERDWSSLSQKKAGHVQS